MTSAHGPRSEGKTPGLHCRTAVADQCNQVGAVGWSRFPISGRKPSRHRHEPWLAQVGTQDPPTRRSARLAAVAVQRAGPSRALPGQAPKQRTWVRIQSAETRKTGQDSTGVDNPRVSGSNVEKAATARARLTTAGWFNGADCSHSSSRKATGRAGGSSGRRRTRWLVVSQTLEARLARLTSVVHIPEKAEDGARHAYPPGRPA
jgi:hypothetical protein